MSLKRRLSTLPSFYASVFGCLLGWSSLSLADCQITMRWNDDPPFSFVSDITTDKVTGISVDVAREAFSRLGCQLRFSKLPWARALEELRVGRIDLISGAYKKPEREVYALFSTQGIVSPNVLFVRTEDIDKWHFKSLAELPAESFRLGAQINVSYSREYDQLMQTDSFSRNVQSQSDRISLWKMLAVNRIDGVIADLLTGRQELHDLQLQDKVKATDFIVSNEPSFFAFSRATTSQTFVDNFDEVISQMREEGLLDKIVNQYLD